MDENMKTSTRKYDPEIVYKLSQLQAILWLTNSINHLLGDLYASPRICDMINCTFIYNCILQQSKVFSKKLLPLSLEEKFQNTASKILSCLKYLDERATKISSGKKKRSKRQQLTQTMAEKEMLENEISRDEIDNFFDKENIFSVLKIE